MATNVKKTEKLKLGEVEVTLAPLKIKKLREFMEAMGKGENAKKDSDYIDVISGAAALAFEACAKELPDGFDFEDEADMEDIKQILRVCGGIDLDAAADLMKATA